MNVNLHHAACCLYESNENELTPLLLCSWSGRWSYINARRVCFEECMASVLFGDQSGPMYMSSTNGRTTLLQYNCTHAWDLRPSNFVSQVICMGSRRVNFYRRSVSRCILIWCRTVVSHQASDDIFGAGRESGRFFIKCTINSGRWLRWFFSLLEEEYRWWKLYPQYKKNAAVDEVYQLLLSLDRGEEGDKISCKKQKEDFYQL